MDGKAPPDMHVTVNGQATERSPDGSFLARVPLTSPGRHEIVAVGIDPRTGRAQTARIVIDFPDIEADLRAMANEPIDPATVTISETARTDACCPCD